MGSRRTTTNRTCACLGVCIEEKLVRVIPAIVPTLTSLAHTHPHTLPTYLRTHRHGHGLEKKLGGVYALQLGRTLHEAIEFATVPHLNITHRSE